MELRSMKKLSTALFIGAAFVAGAAHASSESSYPFPDNAVSPVQENLIVEQNSEQNSAYPVIRVKSTSNRSEVQRDLAVYQAVHTTDEYIGN
jgi:hypothetical protein